MVTCDEVLSCVTIDDVWINTKKAITVLAGLE